LQKKLKTYKSDGLFTNHKYNYSFQFNDRMTQSPLLCGICAKVGVLLVGPEPSGAITSLLMPAIRSSQGKKDL
jgi:hypothetical protein